MDVELLDQYLKVLERAQMTNPTLDRQIKYNQHTHGSSKPTVKGDVHQLDKLKNDIEKLSNDLNKMEETLNRLIKFVITPQSLDKEDIEWRIIQLARVHGFIDIANSRRPKLDGFDVT